MTVEERLRERGIEIPETRPMGIYAPAVRSRDLVFTSGQVAARDGRVVHPGRLGAEVSLEEGREAARIATLNALGAVRGLLGSLEGLRVIRLTGYVASAAGFHDQPEVMNAASELLREVFGEEHGTGTRSAVGVAALPANAPVEVELVVETG